MKFYEKLQILRKQNGLTQEQLAEKLYVSRTAVSKWESDRGYPNLDSLKAISKCFGVSVDELLSENSVPQVSFRTEKSERRASALPLIFGLADCFFAILFFIPVFGQKVAGVISGVSLISLGSVMTYTKISFISMISLTALFGIVELSLQNCKSKFWTKNRFSLSIILGVADALLFAVSTQAYATCFAFVFLVLKFIFLYKFRVAHSRTV